MSQWQPRELEVIVFLDLPTVQRFCVIAGAWCDSAEMTSGLPAVRKHQRTGSSAPSLQNCWGGALARQGGTMRNCGVEEKNRISILRFCGWEAK